MSETPEELRASVQQRFTDTALVPEKERKFPVGPESARKLGYDAAEIDAMPASATESFCGVGNPLGLGAVRLGETVLDLGCGAGLDSILAARRVGPAGHVIGVDMTPAMIDKAQGNAQAVGAENIDFRRGTLEDLPVEDGTVDVAISNGVFNLCPDKPKVLAEVFRVLRPGGRLQMADILLHDDVTPEEVATKGTWSDWIAGAIWERSLLEMLAEAGFVDADFHGWTGYHTSTCTEGALITARRPRRAA